MDRLTAVSMFAAALLAMSSTAPAAPPEASAAETDDTDVVMEPPVRDPDTTIDTTSRRVYNVDDIGMIIGGASEDAKAKVRRLPVQK